MKIITVSFDFNHKKTYQRLMEVFEYSCKKHMPESDVISLKTPAPDQKLRAQGVVSNTYKLDLWVQELDKAKEGEEVVFMDCDMVVLGNMFDAFADDFDVAYTTRTRGFPINGGVIFARNNERARKWFRELRNINNRMFEDKIFHTQWRNKYAGINQAAMGYLIENPVPGVMLHAVPCAKWNVCNDGWKNINKDARAIHVKGALRRACMGKVPPNANMGQCYRIWKQYEAEAHRLKKNKAS